MINGGFGNLFAGSPVPVKVGYTQLVLAATLAQSLGVSVKGDSGSYEIAFEQKSV